VDEALASIAAQHKVGKALDQQRPAQLGDTVLYNMEYTLPSGEVKTQQGSFVLGSGMFPQEFEKGIIGFEKGKVISEKFRVPKHFPDASIAGQKVRFSVSFLDIQESVDSEINDDLAKKIGMDSLEALKKRLEEEIQESAQTLMASHQKFVLRNHLIKKYVFDIPNYLRDSMASQALAFDMAEADIDPHAFESLSPTAQSELFQRTFGKTREALYEEKKILADHYWRIYFMCRDISQKENIQVTSEEMTQEIRRMDQESGKGQKFSQYLRENPQEQQAFYRNMLIEKVLDALVAQCPKGSKPVCVTLEELHQKHEEYESIY
jgi:trigger factor